MSDDYANGHKYSRDLQGIAIDKGAREEIAKPCCKRLENGGWCTGPIDHDGACWGPARVHGPIESIWDRHRGQMVICGKVVKDPVVCLMQRGHHGACK